MRNMKVLFLFMSICCFAIPAMAQGGAVGVVEANWTVAAACIAMAIASGLCGLGQGRATASAAEALARNPAAAPGIRFALLLGLILIESLALYTFAIIFLNVKKQ